MNNQGSVLGYMLILIIMILAILGTIAVVVSFQDYYSPITNGTVDIGMGDTLNLTGNMTTTMVDVGANGIFWLFFIMLFIGVFSVVYLYLRR